MIIRVLLIPVFAHGPPLVGRHQRKGWLATPCLSSVGTCRQKLVCTANSPTPATMNIGDREMAFAYLSVLSGRRIRLLRISPAPHISSSSDLQLRLSTVETTLDGPETTLLLCLIVGKTPKIRDPQSARAGWSRLPRAYMLRCGRSVETDA